ncbi:MarR family winged helix-turn-helix transcriptional regulator [Glaciibacter superstes]|uniref:MarR family winged helix-turn-helix transcriptional regulator n=1 Tax=Glaciibacter superstes TaxID=501023 RepID=UPI0003B6ACC2|nr:MarR family transcriptional regulator [Glaciibacter superstes]
MPNEDPLRPPGRLESLTQWQSGKIATLGARLTSSRMPLGGRADFAVLAALQQFGPLSQADIGRSLGLDRNDVNEVVGRLEGAHHVHRMPNPTDRRRNTVTITAQGARHLDELEAIAHEIQNDLLQGLDQNERVQLRALLRKVLASHGPQPS